MFESTQPLIMGILNITPDSFSDGGKYIETREAIRQAQTMIAAGADIIDIGGESTRPGSLPVPADQQIRRVVPVIRAIRKLNRSISLSIDTTNTDVAAAAVQAGATIINDISAGLHDSAMLDFVAASNSGIILMHMQGSPLTMQDNPQYDNAVYEIETFLQQRIAVALATGVKRERIALDPGIGFGKRRQDNINILANLQRFVALGYPVLLGTSRKRFMGSLCRIDEPSEKITLTAVTTALGVMAGVNIFRVHDVAANRQAATLAWAIKQAHQS